MANNEEILLNLMQNVSDELEHIEKKINDLERSKEKDDELFEKQRNLLAGNLNATNTMLSKVLAENPPIVNHTHHTQYTVFGKDTPFSSKMLLILIASLLLLIPLIKYVPPYMNERSTIAKERDDYKLFYEYVFYRNFEADQSIPKDLQQMLKNIETGDTTYTNYVNRLSRKYENYLKKEDLKAQLKKLEE